jgi:uncharacterized membrane protein
VRRVHVPEGTVAAVEEVPMDLGPVDIVVLAFPGEISAATFDALGAVEARNDIRLIDALVVIKDADGNVTGAEFGDIESLQDAAADLLARGASGLIGLDDVDEVGQVLEPGSSALALLVEHAWARELAGAVRDAEGRLVASVRIPHEFITEAATELADAARAPTAQAGSASA